MRASPGRLAGRPCSTEQALCGLRAKVIEDYPHMMPAYDPNVCGDVCRLFLSCREAAGEKAELKGLIAGCGGQAFEHLPVACPPDPAPWCGSSAITGQARAGRWRRRPRPFLMVAGLPAPFVCGRPHACVSAEAACRARIRRIRLVVTRGAPIRQFWACYAPRSSRGQAPGSPGRIP